jgi:L-threonylcarbamoyladenylate synthase
MGVPYVFEVINPYRAPDRLRAFGTTAGDRGIEVLITAGNVGALIANSLSAFTNLPIIGVPIDASPLRGQDALYSMVMAPPGAPVATVGINNSENAAILAAQILALHHVRIREVLAYRRMASAQRMEVIQQELCDEYPDLCLLEKTAPESAGSGNDYDTDPGPSDLVTPEPAFPKSEWIRPGATLVERASGVGALVPTPVPQEPGNPARLAASSYEEERARTQSGLRRIPSTPPIRETNDAIGDPPTEGKLRPRTPTPRLIKTKVFGIDRDAPDEDVIDHAMMVLLEGGIVGLPTDTVYGLAADATNNEAVERLYFLKGREHQKTLGVLIHHQDMLRRLVSEIPPDLERVLLRFWPGALTVILPRDPNVLAHVSGSDRIGVRVPSDPTCLSVISRVGRPIAMRNATIDSPESITNAKELIDHFTGHVECILDGGDCPSTVASTVLNATGEKFEILREGSVTRAQLKEILGDRLKD